MKRLLHLLGYHDWFPVWRLGDVWTECSICGVRYQVPPDDLAEVPPGTIIIDKDPTPAALRARDAEETP